MPSATEPELPSPWREFLLEVDDLLSEPIALHCLGGFVTTARYGLRRVTGDLYFQHVTVASLPDSYGDRLTELFPGQFRHLTLFALEPHDLALSKLARNSPVDRED